MAEEGGHVSAAAPPPIDTHVDVPLRKQRTHNSAFADHDADSPLSPRIRTPNPFSRKNTSLDIDDYFVCSRLHSNE